MTELQLVWYILFLGSFTFVYFATGGDDDSAN